MDTVENVDNPGRLEPNVVEVDWNFVLRLPFALKSVLTKALKVFNGNEIIANSLFAPGLLYANHTRTVQNTG